MSESPKDELTFSYTRYADGMFHGQVVVTTNGREREPFKLIVSQEEWVRFVVQTIRTHHDADRVLFVLQRDGAPYHYALNTNTIERIRDASLPVEDFIL